MAQMYNDNARIRNAFWAFTTRRVSRDAAKILLPLEGAPHPGDLVLATVDFLGQHPGLQLPNGRRKQLFPGDEIVVAYGNRYASNQFEAVVPETLGPCHLVAGGGIASRAVSWHVSMRKGPTLITPVGLLGDLNNRRINLSDHALSPINEINTPLPTAIAVVGTGMDSGKTQSCAFLVRGLIAAGLRVGYAKITGTGAGGDTWLLTDAGAYPVLDFTDAGMATTYMISIEQLELLLMTLMGHLARENVDAMVLEIADGVIQQETAALLKSPVFASLVAGIVMASQDSMGASAGVHFLKNNAKPPVLAISGIISAAPLQVREATTALKLPVYDREGLATAGNAVSILAGAQRSMETRQTTQPSLNLKQFENSKENGQYTN
ncbi:DUF1611 domain-containing protein [Nitrosomonas sp.]|uniref:DUF1611 domain-containing protein n=1 Tax=Nitrosomonas sp. TaxID=42353 RepID=UPI0032EE8020